jgi:hypothetical protein
MRAVAGKVPLTTYTGPRPSHYIPRIDKLDGYYHFPSPMVLPYTNNIDPNKPMEAKRLHHQQIETVRDLLVPGAMINDLE